MPNEQPVQHELLDWLAVEFVGQSMEYEAHSSIDIEFADLSTQLVARTNGRCCVATESKYRLDKPALLASNVRRLEAEEYETVYFRWLGRSTEPWVAADIDYQDGETNHRRSLYFRHAYEKQMQLLVTFDAANPTDCYRRSESIIPQQSLAMANSPLAMDKARILSQRISKQCERRQRLRERCLSKHTLSTCERQ